ncbi:hypothetical protein [Haladaptatus sp. DYF46]|uniref:hypothetical protein n=1 Tax=Haladaptatus sp. DYF46 TaxID=2886041 RepID=UPI001E288E4A|nr:hypothetical protein [Haladaptatus sp. DYF46]
MSSEFKESYVIWGIVTVAVLTLLYSVLLAGRFLSWFGIALPLLGLYLFWRFVRAVERIADEMER